MEKKPLVTVLTPTYNRVHLLETLVQSLCRQSAQDFQWLVVDDGSTDGTEQYFAELKKRELPFAWEYHRQENGAERGTPLYSGGTGADSGQRRLSDG